VDGVVKMDPLDLQIAGFLSMIAQGYRPDNLSEQAQDLLNKLGDKVAEEEEQPKCEHVWRLNKHGRICVVCMKIEEGKSPYEGRTKK